MNYYALAADGSRFNFQADSDEEALEEGAALNTEYVQSRYWGVYRDGDRGPHRDEYVGDLS